MAEHPRKITTTGQVGLVHPNGTSTAVSATGTGAAKIQINVGTGGEIEWDAKALEGIQTATFLKQVACPAFVANAASIAMGTLKVSECEIEATRTLAANSTLTLSPTDSVAGTWVRVTCKALALGYTLQLVNGGAAGGNLGAAIPASLTVARSYLLYCDGANYFAQSFEYV